MEGEDMSNLILEEIKPVDIPEAIALIVDSSNVNNPFALSGEWIK
jgi:hypothetical protein